MNYLLGHDTAVQSKDIESTIGVFVGYKDQGLLRIRGSQPDRRVVGVMSHCFRDGREAIDGTLVEAQFPFSQPHIRTAYEWGQQ
jgi:hypothetical protein